MTAWRVSGDVLIACNCDWGCPCNFNARPSKGFCEGGWIWLIEQGHVGDVSLDGLGLALFAKWPGAIHEGKGEAAVVVDARATEAQRGALLRILSGQDTEPGATVFNVFASTLEKLHDPIFAPIDFTVDVAGRKARLVVQGVTEGRGEPILNPVTGAEHRVRIDMVDSFEYTLAEIGRGWTKTSHPIKLELADSYGQFAEIHLCQSGVVR